MASHPYGCLQTAVMGNASHGIAADALLLKQSTGMYTWTKPAMPMRGEKSGVGVGLGAAERNASFYMTLAASSHWVDKLTE